MQAYVYGAKRHAAMLARAIGDPAMAFRFEDEANVLRVRFEAAFWCDELSTYGLALDGAKRLCRVVSSNAGHTLLTGIAEQSRAERVADTLLGMGCFSGWGIRTVARTMGEAAAPISFGFVSQYAFGGAHRAGHATGLEYTLPGLPCPVAVRGPAGAGCAAHVSAGCSHRRRLG